jgi:hypothetical protein
MDWGMFGALVGLFAGQTTVLLWMMNKLDNDIRTVSADSNAKWMAANARSDALQASLNDRIDTTQGIIMRMLEKQGR